MDPRRTTGARQPDRPVAEVETDAAAFAAKVTGVGGSTGGIRRATVVGAAVIAVLGFALGASMAARPSTPETVPALGVSSASPALGSPSAIATSGTAAPTERPTSPPAWFWSRSELLPGAAFSPEEVWAIGDRAFILGHRDMASAERGGWALARLEPPADWTYTEPPGAIEILSGGSVVDDRLWFVAQVGGVSDADDTWQLVSTGDGQTWDTLGRSTGLAPGPGLEFGGAAFVRRVGAIWVASLGTFRYDEATDTSEEVWRLLWSRDGQSWQPAEIESADRNMVYFYDGVLGDKAIVLGASWTEETPRYVILTSTNGRRWSSVPFELPPDNYISGLACNTSRCLVTAVTESGLTAPTAVVSLDGDRWETHTVDLPRAAVAGGPVNVVPVDGGFLAMSMNAGQALLTQDGMAWRAVDVMSARLDNGLIGLVVAGDEVIAIEPDIGDGSVGVWRGRLSRIPAR